MSFLVHSDPLNWYDIFSQTDENIVPLVYCRNFVKLIKQRIWCTSHLVINLCSTNPVSMFTKSSKISQTPSIKPHHWQTKLSQLAIIDLLAATGLESQSNFNILQNVKKKNNPKVHRENKILIKCMTKITFYPFRKFVTIRNVVTRNTSHFSPKIGHTVWSKCSFST